MVWKSVIEIGDAVDSMGFFPSGMVNYEKKVF